MTSILFYLLTLLILVSAIKVVTSTNLVHSALFLVASFVGIALVYLLLYADFIALVQILVYVGAVSVLLVFGVMLTKRGGMGESNPFNRYRLAAAFVAAAFFSVVGYVMLSTKWNIAGSIPPYQSTIEQIAGLLLKDYAIPFEAAGLLLLVAVVGAILIGKGESDFR